jgi:hypothetical protein
MQCSYGNYVFPANQTELGSSVRLNINKGGQPYSQTRRVRVSGFLGSSSVSGQDQLILAENLLRTALAANFLDLKFIADDGTLVAALSLLNGIKTCITGVKIVSGPDFTTTKGPEYATLRSFSFEAEAEYFLTTNPANMLLDFQETLTFGGGLPLFRHRNAVNGPPQKQLVYPQTPYTATQSGHAVGLSGPPALGGPNGAPPAKWPGALMEGPSFSPTSPTRKGRGYEGFGLTWSYRFEDVGPLAGTPTLWIN